MTKVKILRGENGPAFVNEVNEFVKGKNVVSITHAATYVNTVYNPSGTPITGTFYDSVMVVYKED